jgi:hypothetical protein
MTDDNDPCELCDKDAVVMCEGFLVCEDCCYLYASELAQMHDDIQDELRGS